MSLKYLLDTNIISEPLRRKPHSAILRNLRRHEDEVAISSIVWHELRFGVERLPISPRRAVIEQYLRDVILVTMPIIEYDRAAAEWHAAERARLAARGDTPPFADGQIAAIAHAHDLILVTRNAVDFRRFRGITIEVWE